ncbi:PilW family protein [Ideonella sp.]|uniref:PilW family protein n=1 Tax=Ideonella sp. TaxID=1929293 RepID=UPI002B480B75|nr:PilW family protein [Ideonella sp.]HJV70791.1 PilW family protein [Ideonella sp.]
MKPRALLPRLAVQAGFSLIELMISMVIGMVVVGAVLAAYLGAGTGSKAGHALSQVTEDASLALNVLRNSISMVGYGAPIAVTPGGKFQKWYAGTGLRGCDKGFTNPEAATIDLLNCPAGDDGGPDSVAVAYQADTWNSVNSGGVPLDCLGNTLTDAGGGNYLNYARFYVRDGNLYCRGRVPGQEDALVENVVDLQVLYGVAVMATPNQATHYMKADNMLFDALTVDDFDRVVSVRLCVVIRSTDEVMDTPMAYLDCGSNEVTAGDRRLYRSFTTTVVLQNRLGGMM